MFKRVLQQLGTVVLALEMGFASWAGAQSAYGPGGLFMMPSGYVSPEGSVNLGMMGSRERAWKGHHLWISNAVAYGLSNRTQIGFTQILIQDENRRPSWGPFGKYQLISEGQKSPALAVSGVWLPNGRWRMESVALSASKAFHLSETVQMHLHTGILHAHWFNGKSFADLHPTGNVPENPHLLTQDHRQVPFVGIDVSFGQHVKLTAEGRQRLGVDNPDAIPAKVGVIFALPKGGRLGFAWGGDGLDTISRLTIGVGYNIAVVE